MGRRASDQGGEREALVGALNRAAAALHRARPAGSQLFRLALQELGRIGLRGGVSLIDPGGETATVYGAIASEDSATLRMLEKLTGLKVDGHRFEISRVQAYADAISTRAPVVAESTDVVTQLLPPKAGAWTRRVLAIFGGRTTVVAPIVGCEGPVGVLSVTGRRLCEADAPALMAFANHIAAAHDNARQVEKIHTLSQAVEQSPSIVMITDPEGAIEYVNPRFEQVTGYSSHEVMGRNPRFLSSGEAGPPVYAALWRTIKGGGQWRGVFRNRKKNGELYWESAAISPVLDATGEIRHFIAVKEDITRRREAEQEREAAHNLLQHTIDGVDEPIMVIGLDHSVMFTNRAVRERYGDQTDGAPTTCYRLSHRRETPCDQGGEDCPLQTVRETLHPTTVMHTHRDKDGGARQVEVIAAPLMDASGKLVGIIESGRDVTDRRRLEREVARSRHLESLGLLAGGIAHDFNNLLAVILGNIGYVRPCLPADAAQARQALRDATTACERARELTAQLLTFAKGGAPIKTVMRLQETLERAARLTTAGTNVRCGLELPDALWPVEADAGQLYQVFHNLLLNAVQSMPGGGHIEVRATPLTLAEDAPVPLPPGPYVRVIVQDDGPGVRPEDADRIFDPYFTTREDGSGLGLPTAYSIVRNHGGRLRLSTGRGRGARFEVYLPARPGARVEGDADAAVKEASPPAPTPLRVLLMDDEPAVGRLVARVLTRSGHEVRWTEDGAAAIAAYGEAMDEGRPFDVVILDLTVPGGVGGVEALAGLKALDPDVRALVSSGYSEDPVMSDHAAHGFAGIIAKPYTLDELRRVLAEL